MAASVIALPSSTFFLPLLAPFSTSCTDSSHLPCSANWTARSTHGGTVPHPAKTKEVNKNIVNFFMASNPICRNALSVRLRIKQLITVSSHHIRECENIQAQKCFVKYTNMIIESFDWRPRTFTETKYV